MEITLSQNDLNMLALKLSEYISIDHIESPLALLSATEISKRYNLSVNLVRELWDIGTLPFVRRKGIKVSFRKDVDAYLISLQNEKKQPETTIQQDNNEFFDEKTNELFLMVKKNCDEKFRKKKIIN